MGNLQRGLDTVTEAIRAYLLPGAFAAKTVDLSTDAPGTYATGVLTSNNTNVSDADQVVIGSKTYTFKTALTEAKATGTLTSDNTNVDDGDTVTIGTHVYRFKTVPLQANDVFIGADADTSMGSLIHAINGDGTVGVDYFAGTTASADVTAGALSSHAFTVTEKTIGTAGNAIATTETSGHLSWGGATLSGGADSVANEILIDVDADTSLTNLKKAINGEAGGGTNYSTATTASTQVTSSAVASHALTITAIAEGTVGNSIATTKTAVTLSWGATTLTGGTDNLPLFTITGDVLYAVIGICKTSLTGAGAKGEVGFAGNLAAAIPQFTAASLTANKIIDSTGIITPGTAPKTTPALAAADQTLEFTETDADITAGVIHFYCVYIPLSAGAKVTAA